jgi:hypothetical protein
MVGEVPGVRPRYPLRGWRRGRLLALLVLSYLAVAGGVAVAAISAAMLLGCG